MPLIEDDILIFFRWELRETCLSHIRGAWT